jgi:hypothetical protein
VIDDADLDRRYVEHLAGHLADNRRRLEVGTASRTARRLVGHGLVGDAASEIAARSSGLFSLSASRVPARSTALGAVLARGDRISRRGLGRVLGVTAELGFESDDAITERFVLGSELCVQRDLSIERRRQLAEA